MKAVINYGLASSYNRLGGMMLIAIDDGNDYFMMMIVVMVVVERRKMENDVKNYFNQDVWLLIEYLIF